MTKTKLVVYTENYFPGGLERFIFDVITNDLFNIHIIVNSENMRIIQFAKENNIKYTIVKLNNFRFGLSKYKYLNKSIKIFNFIIYYLFIFVDYFKVKHVLKQLVNYENIMVVNGGYPAALSTLVATVAAKKLGFQQVGLSILSSLSLNYKNIYFKFFQSKIDHYTSQYIDFYIPNSKKIKSELISHLNIDAKKIKVIYTGINILSNLRKKKTLYYKNQIITKKNDDVWLCMVALLGSTKRQDIIIDAISKLDNNYKLLLVGDGPDRIELEKKAKELGVDDRVFFLGWMSNVEDIYLFADLIVFVSEHEGLPYAISEAMAYKLPIIASCVGGISEQIIDNQGGLLLYSNDADSLIEKIIFLSKRKDLINKFTNFSLMRVEENFSIKAMTSKISRLYNKEEN